MNVLAFDTATEVLALCAARSADSGAARSADSGVARSADSGAARSADSGVAWSADSGVARDDVWASLCLRRGMQHSPALLPLAEQLLAHLGMGPADLQLVVCSLGPGSFTGIRIGLATALGIGHGRGIPVVGVSTLDAIALSWAGHDGDVFPVIDARKGKIYTARFRGGVRQGEYVDGTPADLARMTGGAERPLLAGPDAERIREMLGAERRSLPCGISLDPLSHVKLGVVKYTTDGADPGALRPLYLRKSEAEIASGL